MSKIDKLAEALKKKEMTVEELVKLTGLAKSTVLIQLNYHLPKKGFKVVKTNKDGKLAYKIEG